MQRLQFMTRIKMTNKPTEDGVAYYKQKQSCDALYSIVRFAQRRKFKITHSHFKDEHLRNTNESNEKN